MNNLLLKFKNIYKLLKKPKVAHKLIYYYYKIANILRKM